MMPTGMCGSVFLWVLQTRKIGGVMSDNAINPADIDYRDKPLWCVYGPACFPTMICCKVNDASGKLAIWGYSVYRRSPGFRTLGRYLNQWTAENNAVFFADQNHALDFLKKITWPRIKQR